MAQIVRGGRSHTVRCTPVSARSARSATRVRKPRKSKPPSLKQKRAAGAAAVRATRAKQRALPLLNAFVLAAKRAATAYSAGQRGLHHRKDESLIKGRRPMAELETTRAMTTGEILGSYRVLDKSIKCIFWRPGKSTRQFETGRIVAIRFVQGSAHILAMIKSDAKSCTQHVGVHDVDVYV